MMALKNLKNKIFSSFPSIHSSRCSEYSGRADNQSAHGDQSAPRIRHESEPGFSLIEVVISITIFSLVISSLFVLQGRLLERSSDAFNTWKSVVYLKNFMSEADRKDFVGSELGQHKKTVEPGPVQLNYSIKKISENSALKNIKNLKIIQADASWQDIGASQNERLVSFAVVPSKEKQE